MSTEATDYGTAFQAGYAFAADLMRKQIEQRSRRTMARSTLAQDGRGDANGTDGRVYSCRDCGEAKTADRFKWIRGQMAPACRDCSNARQRATVPRGGRKPRGLREPTEMTIPMRYALVNELKALAGCTDCGVHPEDVRLLQFDHMPGHVKRWNISWAVAHPGKCSDADLFVELRKCEVVCQACHSLRTVRRIDEGIKIDRAPSAFVERYGPQDPPAHAEPEAAEVPFKEVLSWLADPDRYWQNGGIR